MDLNIGTLWLLYLSRSEAQEQEVFYVKLQSLHDAAHQADSDGDGLQVAAEDQCWTLTSGKGSEACFCHCWPRNAGTAGVVCGGNSRLWKKEKKGKRQLPRWNQAKRSGLLSPGISWKEQASPRCVSAAGTTPQREHFKGTEQKSVLCEHFYLITWNPGHWESSCDWKRGKKRF